MSQREGFTVDGLEYKCRIDVGASMADYRGAYMNYGE